jgi:hypothetical protein
LRYLENDSDDSDDLHGSQEPHNPGVDWCVRITNADGIIRLYDAPDFKPSSYQLLNDLLIASTGGVGHGSPSIARKVDRKWIDPGLVKTWKTSCASEHGIGFSTVSKHSHHRGSFPRPPLPLLVDTVEGCLVEGTDDAAYICRSYVWGKLIVGQETIKTTTETLHRFRQPEAFRYPDGVLLPRTIRDAMGVTRLLGERYLWVDALCIVQDDNDVRYSLIHNMHAVYANATVTIVAADSADADAGLKGIQGVSSIPRDNPCIFEWPDGTILNLPSRGLRSAIWNEVRWTFQEYLFSQRRLIFVADSVHWECPHGCFWEEYTDQGQLPTTESCAAYEPDNMAIRITAGSMSILFPDPVAFKTLVDGFNSRQFTYLDDVMDGFSGAPDTATGSRVFNPVELPKPWIQPRDKLPLCKTQLKKSSTSNACHYSCQTICTIRPKGWSTPKVTTFRLIVHICAATI